MPVCVVDESAQVDANQVACYQHQVLRRILSALVVCAVVAAYATAADDGAPGTHGGTTVQAGSSHLALCPATRTGLQIGRQVEGRSGAPQAAIPGVLSAAGEAIAAARWTRYLLDVPRLSKRGTFEASGRITRGPPRDNS